MPLTRRNVLTGAAVGGGLVVAWMLYPRSFPDPLDPGRDEYAFDAWLKIASDGVVTVAVPQLEMGQGITTLLPQVVAAELGADWRQVAVEPAPVSGAFANIPLAAKWSALWMPFAESLADEPDSLLATRFAQSNRFSATADGTSLAAFEEPCRIAAASARAMLAQAAGARWNVAPEECEVANGIVSHSDASASFGELAQEAAGFDAPDPPPLRSQPFGEQALAGAADAPTAFPRLDMPAKVDGSLQFAGDVRLPGMVYAAIRHSPVDKGVVSDFNPLETRNIRGIVGAVNGKRWMAVAATNWWAADRALEAMTIRFNAEYLADSDIYDDRLREALRYDGAHSIATRGEGYSSGGTPDLALRYEVDAGVHATLETASATARYQDGKLELWLASQAPEQARSAAAKAIGIGTHDVVLYPMPAGGSFDRRLEHDHAIEVAIIARELGRPVQLVWSRREEMQRGRPRAPAHLLLSARIGKDGQALVEGLKTRIATPSWNREFGLRLFENKVSWAAVRDSTGLADPMACEGAMPVYAIPNVSVEHVPVEIGLPCGRMRGNANSYTAFAIESFIDEVATRNNREPLSHRIAMLGSDVRLAQCLQQAARMAGWDGGADQSGQGLACHRIGEGDAAARIACIVTARQGEGGLRVASMTAVVDIGRIVNIDIARQQVEGGLIFGLATAMGASTRFRSGIPEATQLNQLALPQLADSPEIEVDFIASDAPPTDPGELGAVVAPPAIANALHSATGLRMRRLPLLSGGL